MTSGALSGPVFVAVLPLVLFSDTARPAGAKTVTMTVIIIAGPFSRLRDNSCFIGAQHAPHSPSHGYPRLLLLCSDYPSIIGLNKIPYDGFVFAEIC